MYKHNRSWFAAKVMVPGWGDEINGGDSGTQAEEESDTSTGVFPRLSCLTQLAQGRRSMEEHVGRVMAQTPLFQLTFHCREFSHMATPNGKEPGWVLTVCMGRRKAGFWWVDGLFLPLYSLSLNFLIFKMVEQIVGNGTGNGIISVYLVNAQ